MTKQIIFNKDGYDPFIDFIKAYAIICVLFGHTFGLILDKVGYCFWAGMQVPLFILVQTFHYYKISDSTLKLKKLLKRIILPFVCFGLLELLAFCFVRKWNDSNLLIINWLKGGGGYGPGSYYPLVYIQISLLLPVFKSSFKRLSNIQLFWLFFFIAEGLEILCSLIHPEWSYRLLCIRYIFLIYLGWKWTTEGVVLNTKMIVLSVVSFMTIIYFEYITDAFSINNEPWFFNTTWKYHRWPCYYYVANGLVYIIYVIWKLVKNNVWIETCIKK